MATKISDSQVSKTKRYLLVVFARVSVVTDVRYIVMLTVYC